MVVKNLLNNLKKKYSEMSIHIRASLWFLICSVLQKGITVLTTPIFTRLLSTSEYGQFQVFNSWLSIVSVFVTLKLYYGVYTQGLIKFSEIRRRYSAALQGLTLTLCSFGLLVAIVFNEFWQRIFSLSDNQVIALIVMCWTNSIYEFWATDKRVSLSYRILVVASITIALCKPIVGIIVINCFTDRVSARIWGIIAVEFVGYFPMFLSQVKKGKTLYDNQIWRYALRFNIPLIPHYLSQTLLIDSDKIMIKKIVGDEVVGIYGLAYSIAQIMTLVNSALLQTITPWMYQKIKDNDTSSIKRIIQPALILIAGTNILLVCVAPEIVHLFAPKEYYDAIWVIPPIAMSVCFMFAYSVFANFEFYYERTKFVTFATCIAAGTNIILNYIFIPMFGYYAAGYTTLIGYLLYSILHFRYMVKICKEKNIEKPTDLKFIIVLFFTLVSIGTVIEISFEHTALRYCILGLIIGIMILGHKKIISFIAQIKK